MPSSVFDSRRERIGKLFVVTVAVIYRYYVVRRTYRNPIFRSFIILCPKAKHTLEGNLLDGHQEEVMQSGSMPRCRIRGGFDIRVLVQL